MGEYEKCPKCGARLRFNSGGYAHVNASEGIKATLPDNYSCAICGYYREEFPEKKAEEHFKKGFITRCYPEHRKPMGESGWLKEIVAFYMWEIVVLRTDNTSWAKIQKTLSKKEPRFNDTAPQAISNSFRRLVEKAQRGEL